MIIECSEVPSPVGRLTIAVAETKLVALCFEGHWRGRHEMLKKQIAGCEFTSAADPARVVTKLRRYFDGDFEALDTIETQSFGTPFQESIWKQLRRIPAGETRSYGELARAAGFPAAVRAAGAANGANPVAVVVPCHRVIGSDGRLTGFGGGLPRKQWLLEHEGAQLAILSAGDWGPSRFSVTSGVPRSCRT
jgi:methylated-DNA-[protein]-cysteine S-methyltransferase